MSDVNFVIVYSKQFLSGIFVTLSSWVFSAALSLILGVCLGILSSKFLALAYVGRFIRLYTFVAKGVPAYVQILIAYFVLPSLFGINLSGFLAASFALAFCSSGYVTEIIRAGMNSINPGQWDACYVLGYSKYAAIKRIIFPQALANILPALLGEFEQLLKSTSLLATIGVTDLTRVGMNIISRELDPLPIYLTIACVYLIMSGLLQVVVAYLEKRCCYGRG